MQSEKTERHLRYAELLRDYRGNIISYCMRHCRNRAEAGEMMHEVFVALWEGIDGLNEDSTPRQVNKWMQRVMATARARLLRQRQQHDMLPLDAIPEPAAQHDDTAEQIADIMATLSEEERTLMRMRLDGYTAPEIAARLRLPLETVKKRFTRTINKMKDRYANEG